MFIISSVRPMHVCSSAHDCPDYFLLFGLVSAPMGAHFHSIIDLDLCVAPDIILRQLLVTCR
jgi:hypothetical protein